MPITTVGVAVQFQSLGTAAVRTWQTPLGSVGGSQSSGHALAWWGTVSGSVVSGIVVAVILAAARVAWHRTRVPSALSRPVWRRRYLGAVRAESRRQEIRTLDVYAPHLQPTKDGKGIVSIQSAWEQIDKRGKVRILTLDPDQSLQAGAELLDKGIEVRVLPSARDLGFDGLTFHLFETADPEAATAIINHHQGEADRPVRIKGAAPTEVFRRHFRTEWAKARPLESVVADRVLRLAGCRGPDAVARAIQLAEKAGLHLGDHSSERILPHLAFKDSCEVVFIVGLPGSGKSYLRSVLEERLESLHIECQSLTDYPYAYLDLVRTVLKLTPPSSNGFKAHDGGAFTVQSEKSLAPALRALHGNVRDTSQMSEVVLVEFARADLAAALQLFDDIRPRSWVIHVSAPTDIRLARLASRAIPPDLHVDGQAITVTLSDNHLLPASAAETLYTADGLDRIQASAHWRDRIFEVNNEFEGSAHIDSKISGFIDAVLAPYRAPYTSAPKYRQLASVRA